MNQILEMLMNSAGGNGVKQFSRQFGISEDQTQGALAQLVPAILAGLHRNTQQEGGMEALVGALSSGGHSRYLDDPSLLANEATVADGNGILGHVFGTKEVSRSVAGQAAEQTGIGADVLKRMLPVVATMVMGSLSRQNTQAASIGGTQSATGFLSTLLDQNRSGGIADEVIGVLGRFLGR
jgi:hypothetical protein